MASAEAGPENTTHLELVVFVHGLTGQVTTTNAAHGQAIAIQLRKLHASSQFTETSLDFSTANAGCCGCSTFV